MKVSDSDNNFTYYSCTVRRDVIYSKLEIQEFQLMNYCGVGNILKLYLTVCTVSWSELSARTCRSNSVGQHLQTVIQVISTSCDKHWLCLFKEAHTNNLAWCRDNEGLHAEAYI